MHEKNESPQNLVGKIPRSELSIAILDVPIILVTHFVQFAFCISDDLPLLSFVNVVL
jgi:hypothetical protein